jgi:3'-5' exoribonuclease
MAGTDTAVVRLSDLEHGQEAYCFAALVKKERGTDKHDKPFVKCHFRDKRVVYVAPFWSGNAMREEAETWQDGAAYRLRARANNSVRWGMQIEILEARPAVAADAEDGYDFFDLVETSIKNPEESFETVLAIVRKCIDDPHLRQLVETLLHDHADLFKKMQAAQNFHHAYTGGLIEHVWSMARVASMLADHYARYYQQLDPPLNKGVIVAAAILHDIGKLRELEYHPVEAKYTKVGCLVGHVLIGRDLVHEAAGKIEGFPEETLLLLEHAILSHHGKKEFGAPVEPQTLESLLVSFVDDLDAKMNAVARKRIDCTTEGDFTDRIWPLDNRRFYKGLPAEFLPDHDIPDVP